MVECELAAGRRRQAVGELHSSVNDDEDNVSAAGAALVVAVVVGVMEFVAESQTDASAAEDRPTDCAVCL